MPAITAPGGQRQKDCDEFQASQDYTVRPSLKTTQNTKHGNNSMPNSSRYNYFWKTKHNYVKSNSLEWDFTWHSFPHYTFLYYLKSGE